MKWTRFKEEFFKPYYIFRPSQFFLRLKRKLTNSQPSSDYEQVTLPWDLPIRVLPFDYIGSAIIRAGLYDLCVSEVLWRLLDPGETAIDAGANIGQMTSLMAKRVTGTGKVISFEPHPQIFQELSSNAALWRYAPSTGTIELHEMGLSNEAGVATLHVPADFTENRGTSSLEENRSAEDGVAHDVPIVRLDDLIESQARIGVMKIDVEGHELHLLQGASSLLTEGRIRDIVFEDFSLYPSPVTDYLEQSGYTIFTVAQGPFSLEVTPAMPGQSQSSNDAPNYLATLDRPRTWKRLSKPGYQSLTSSGDNRKSKTMARAAVAATLLLTVLFLAQKKK